ncbi:MAG: NirD/YgiW/YdeI family stress tolerance protein [Alphaproteobacteria bacterium]|nr:NirD/YgiW/YdeI family stress tolerance protein [Alphaproteobacteria bacterium]MBQ2810603.1 NirD/YgiW/YdeI family stress tolerance protein [Alphaproteobacteria bacterium]
MKKISLTALAVMLCLSSLANAKEHCDYMDKKGGYIVSDSDITTVKTALGMQEDSIVTLQGQIEKRLKKDMYQFKDASGTMMIEIGKKVWHGQTVSAKDTVQITGELDKDDDKIVLDVESLIKK